MIFKVASHARATEAAQEACRKLARKSPSRGEKHKPYFFLYFIGFWPRRAAVQKIAAKMAPEALPESLQGSPGDPPGAQNRSTSRLRPARGARQVIFEISGRLPGSPGEGPRGPRSPQDPPGGAGEAPEAILATFWNLREAILESFCCFFLKIEKHA